MAEREIAYGLNTVRRLLERAPERVLALHVVAGREDKRLGLLLDLAATAGVHVEADPRTRLDKFADGGRHQGVVAYIRGRKAFDENAFWDWLDAMETPVTLLILDGVQDPHNLGACLRAADGAGADAVIVPRKRAAKLTPAARKVASGAAESLPLVRVTNLARTLRQLTERGIHLVGTDDQADKPLYESDLKPPVALVLGGEGKGLRRLTAEHCDELVSIPMAGAVESLNVAVAAGVCLYEAVRQRRK